MGLIGGKAVKLAFFKKGDSREVERSFRRDFGLIPPMSRYENSLWATLGE
jgi:hypothetical protein